MQVMITHGNMRRSKVFHVSAWQIGLMASALLAVLLLVAAVVYHAVFLKAAREGWPVVSGLVQMIGRDDGAQRERYLRENLDAMARKVGEMQAKLVQLEAMGERVSGLAGIRPQELRQLTPPASPPVQPGSGGPFVAATLPDGVPTLETLDQLVAELQAEADQRTDVFTLVESRLFEKRLAELMVPTSRPVDGPIGSRFGFRSDPFSGRAALHTGLDFPADVGTPIHAAAGGVVSLVEHHPQYGLMVELDHGRGLVTRYAHASKSLVNRGDLVKRGQPIAQVGSTGRSTGPHLHFEVLVEGVPQDPGRFLALTEAEGSPATALNMPAR